MPCYTGADFSIDFANKVISTHIQLKYTHKKTIVKLSGGDFSINSADKAISTHIQLKCNNDLLPQCVFSNRFRQKYSALLIFDGGW